MISKNCFIFSNQIWTKNLDLTCIYLIVEIYFFSTSTLNDIDLNEIPPNLTLWDVLNACALFMNGFSMSYNLPQVVQELREHSIKRCDQVLNISCVFVMITYYVFSYTAFRLYGYDTQSNVIGNYPKNFLGNSIRWPFIQFDQDRSCMPPSRRGLSNCVMYL